jgi:hypothetical protein
VGIVLKLPGVIDACVTTQKAPPTEPITPPMTRLCIL